MKKILVFIFAICVAFTSTYAQKGEKSVGLSLGYGSEIESLGIGGRFMYGITDQIRLAPDFTYFMKKDYLSMWDVNLNVHYLFPIKPEFKVYPLAGLIFSHYSVDFSSFGTIPGLVANSSETKFGINLGGGAQYDVAKNISIFAELKYGLVADIDQFVIQAGVAYKF